ncbi:hypothetical protein BT93_H2787 [Corymbia citriodora subsp. variegata]|nr:hypothetical protein BT93_H2787 [Corymbia citriodora subsp. variegata]
MTHLSSTLYFLILLTVLIRTYPSHAQFCYNATGNFTSNSAYAKNRDAVLSSLASNVAAHDGFYATTIVEDPNTIYAITFCRGDSSPDTCASCVKSAVEDLVVKCPNQKAAFSWGTGEPPCIIRYSDTPIYGILQTYPTIRHYNVGNITINSEIWWDLALGLVNQAADGSSKLKFATGQVNLKDNRTIYSMLQCSPDLSPDECRRCFYNAIDAYVKCCREKPGVTAYKPSCIFRWDLYPFLELNPSPPSSSSPPASAPSAPGGNISKGKTNKSTMTIIAIVIPIGGLMALLFLTCFVLRRKGKKMDEVIQGKSGPKEFTTKESSQFDLATIQIATNDFSCEIQIATNDFSCENKLGEGGFGEVFKGRLPNGQQIAVKRLSQSSRQGDEEFKNEVLLVAKLQHRNLVRLLGFCLEGDEKLLAYEFVPNKSLDYFLFDPEKRKQLDWPLRYKIVSGIARGMLYLHEDSRLRIIHRDLKCSNILLDSEMNPKISDFGMARIFGVNQTQANTNKIMGTFGYMSPEYAMHEEFSVKSDVYSFGILLLEIICGKKNNFYHQLEGGKYLASYVWNQWREGMPLEVVDPTIVNSYSRDQVLQCLHICLLCI